MVIASIGAILGVRLLPFLSTGTTVTAAESNLVLVRSGDKPAWKRLLSMVEYFSESLELLSSTAIESHTLSNT